MAGVAVTGRIVDQDQRLLDEMGRVSADRNVLITSPTAKQTLRNLNRDCNHPYERQRFSFGQDAGGKWGAMVCCDCGRVKDIGVPK